MALNKRRGVSNIIGSLVVLAVVASIGSVILFQGLNQINAFNYDLTLHDKEHAQALREDLIFEHVRFDPTSDDMDLYIANIGSIDSTIQSITVVKIDTQELITRASFPTEIAAVNATILVEDHNQIPLTSIVLPTGNQTWADNYYYDKDYKISIATSKGNFFTSIARTPNS